MTKLRKRAGSVRGCYVTVTAGKFWEAHGFCHISTIHLSVYNFKTANLCTEAFEFSVRDVLRACREYVWNSCKSDLQHITKQRIIPQKKIGRA